MNEEEIIYEEDKGDEVVKRLRKRLKTCEQEKKEYLDGWQRLKADNANSKKNNLGREELLKASVKGETLESLFPILDSFDMAFKGESWEDVDEVWRVGVEQIHSQILEVLGSTYKPFGEVGETFDPKRHEAIGSEKGGEANTIAQVVRRGYETEEGVVRAAQVIVYN